MNPETSTPADWKKAADWLKKQQPLVRKYYDQGYIDALAKGDIWATMAWSGDIFQANAVGRPEPASSSSRTRARTIWTDNMCIPQARRASASTR